MNYFPGENRLFSEIDSVAFVYLELTPYFRKKTRETKIDRQKAEGSSEMLSSSNLSLWSPMRSKLTLLFLFTIKWMSVTRVAAMSTASNTQKAALIFLHGL